MPPPCAGLLLLHGLVSHSGLLHLPSAWLRMLQQFPGVSEVKAAALVKSYPTLRSVMDAYERCRSEDEKIVLLVDCWGTKSAQAQLSYSVYRMLQGTNPEEII